MRMNGAGESWDGRLCAEPPPDVADAVARSTTAELTATASGSQAPIQASAAGTFGLDARTAILPLLYRSQGVQLHRDAMSSLCQDYINNVISAEEYRDRARRIFEVSARLVEQEVALLPQISRTLRSEPEGVSRVRASTDGGPAAGTQRAQGTPNR